MPSGQWDYSHLHGPESWANSFPAASGKRQSPIDIHTDKVLHDPSLEGTPLCISYGLEDDYQLTNTGLSVQLSRTSASKECQLRGGPLSHNYRFAQLHFHWGSADSTGSEHLVNGAAFAAELHLVHWNTDLFSSVQEALTQDQGLAVLGVFLRSGEEDHPALKQLTDLFPRVQHKDASYSMGEGFDPESLLPKSRDYWTYPGSLTTPPCSESVTWVIFKDAITVSQQQLEKFRHLHSYPFGQTSGKDIVDNFRHVNPLNGRVVKCSCL